MRFTEAGSVWDGGSQKKGFMKRSVGEIARAIGAKVVGDDHIQISGVASVASASPSDLVFVEDKKNLATALSSAAAALIAGFGAETIQSPKPLLICSQPRLAFARAAEFLVRGEAHAPGIHPTSVIHASVELGKDVAIEAWVSIGDNARIGDRTWIGAGSRIGQGVDIRSDCEIYPNVTVYPGTRIGNRVIVHAGAVLGSDGFGYVRDRNVRAGDLPQDNTSPQDAASAYVKFPQIGRLEIEDDVEIGANTTIDRGALEMTRVGRGTKVDNLVHIGHNCDIGENVIIAAQAGFSGSVTIEDNAIIGGQVGIGEHAHVQEGVLLGGQAGVLPKKILRGKGVPFWGTPAKPLREYLRSLAALAKLGKRE
jgi:UDP-3-O-[3-hydroxymyristoyl] glucosamine N-acyltransferase